MYAKTKDYWNLWDLICVGEYDIRFIQVKTNQKPNKDWITRAEAWGPKGSTFVKEYVVYKDYSRGNTPSSIVTFACKSWWIIIINRMIESYEYCEVGSCNTIGEKAHLISRATLPKALWRSPYFYIMLCHRHHTEQHALGIDTFCNKHGLGEKLENARGVYAKYKSS